MKLRESEENILNWDWKTFIDKIRVVGNLVHLENQFKQQIGFAYSMANDGKNKMPFQEVPYPMAEEKPEDVDKAREKFWKDAPTYSNIKNLI